MMKWNREKERDCSSLFEINKPNMQDAERTPLHLACTFPSLSLITELISDKRTNALVLNSRLKLPSELVPENYLSSWKIIYKFELSKFSLQLRSPLFANTATDLLTIDERANDTRIDHTSNHSAFDFDDAGSSGPSSCSKYASNKKRKFILDLVSLKGIGHQKSLMLQQPQAPNTSPKIDFKNIGNSRLNLVRFAGIQNGFSDQPASLRKIIVPPRPPRKPSTELSLDDVIGQIAESKQAGNSKAKVIKFSIKSPNGFKTNLDISGRNSVDPSSVYSDVSENVHDLSTANKTNNQKTLTNLISTSRIGGSGMRKIQAKNPPSTAVSLQRLSSSKTKVLPFELPVKPTTALIERALTEIGRVAKKLLSSAKIGMLKTAMTEALIQEIGKHLKSIELACLLANLSLKTTSDLDCAKLARSLQGCLGLLKELVTSFASESGAEILIFKHAYLQLVREFSGIAPLQSLLNHELSDLFVGLKKKVNKLQDPASKSRLSITRTAARNRRGGHHRSSQNEYEPHLQ